MVKLALKLVWLGFGLFGVITVGQKYFPQLTPAGLISGVQTSLISDQKETPTINDLKYLDPQQASQVLGQMIKTEVVEIMETAGEQIKTFPARQVKKIKIGACEELLEEDICSVAREIECR